MNSVALVSSILSKIKQTHSKMVSPDDTWMSAKAVGNAGGNGSKAVVDRPKCLELGGLSSFDPKGDSTTLCVP